VAAVSYAVAPAVVAVLQDDLAGKVDVVVGIGGYRDAEQVIRFVTTGAFRPRGESRLLRVAPNAYGRWVFLLANAGRLDSADDARLLQEIARRRWAAGDADIAPLTAGLGPQGRSVLALVENRDPDAVGRLIAALPAGVRREIEASILRLRPSYSPSHLGHGRGDPRALPAAGAAAQRRVSLFWSTNWAMSISTPSRWPTPDDGRAVLACSTNEAHLSPLRRHGRQADIARRATTPTRANASRTRRGAEPGPGVHARQPSRSAIFASGRSGRVH
jgi:hypothetical protein